LGGGLDSMGQMQQKIKSSWKLFFTYLRPEGKTAVLAMGMSVLTVFSLLVRLCPAWYDSFAKYSEFIAGITTFSGYNKEADMRIVRILLIAIPVLYCLFCVLIQWMQKRMQMGRRMFLIFLSAYFFYLVQLMNSEGSSAFWGIALLLFLVSYWLLRDQNAQSEKRFLSFFVMNLLAYTAMQSVCVAFLGMLHIYNISDGVYLIPTILSGILLLVNAYLYRNQDRDMERQKAFWQILIPAGYLGMVYFRYEYEATGEVFTLFYSPRYRYLLYLVFLGSFIYATYSFVKRKEKLYVTTLITVAVLRVFAIPEGILNIDFFHIGEMSTPFMQLEKYGKLPFFDLMPIHGMCDYYYSVIDRLFLDDTYLSMNAAMTIGNLFLAAFLAFVLYQTCDRKEWALTAVYCFMPFMIGGAGIRYIFLFVSFFVLMSAKVRRSGLMYIWWYAMLSILSIAWNMAIGGAGAAAFFVVVLIRYLRGVILELIDLLKRKQRSKLLVLGMLYAVLLGVGIAFIPVFLRIMVYLKENTGTTLMANGMEMIGDITHYKEYLQPSFFTGESVSFLHVFGFLIPLLLCLILAFAGKGEKLRKNSREFALVFFVCFYIIVNYAFVRFDEGLRAGVMSVFFLLALLSAVLGGREQGGIGGKHIPAVFFLLFLAVNLTGDSQQLDLKLMTTNKQVPASLKTTIMGREVDDPVVYVTGDSVGMQSLGSGFIRGNTLQNLQNLKYVVDSELADDRAYLDLTNAIADYIFLDARMVLPYTSGYNISNEQMQKNAIDILRENPPELVMLAPFIRFDEASISLRSPLLYEYLYDAGYEPYVYQNVIYLKQGESVLFEESNGFEAYAELMHKQALAMLPAVWGSGDAADELQQISANGHLIHEEGRLIYEVDGVYSGEEIDFIRIQLPEDDESEAAKIQQQGTAVGGEQESERLIRVLFGENGEEHEFHFKLAGDNFLIPVFSSPYWKVQEQVGDFEVQMTDEEGQYFDSPTDIRVTCYQYPKFEE